MECSCELVGLAELQMRVVIDEATIKIAETKEGLDVFYLPRCRPFRDGSVIRPVFG